MPRKRRAKSVPGDGTGPRRHALYTQAWKQIERAKESRFYIEAIALLESLLADRLECRLAYLTKKERGFLTLGRLTTLLRIDESEDFRKIYPRILAWATLRNEAIHELPKLAQGERTSWATRMQRMPGIVEAGRNLLLELDDLDQTERRKAGKRTGTYPNAFGPPRRETA